MRYAIGLMDKPVTPSVIKSLRTAAACIDGDLGFIKRIHMEGVECLESSWKYLLDEVTVEIPMTDPRHGDIDTYEGRMIDVAAQAGQLEIVIYLCEVVGAKPDSRTLMSAVCGGSVEVIRYLHRFTGGFPDNYDIETPFIAAAWGQIEAFEILMELGYGELLTNWVKMDIIEYGAEYAEILRRYNHLE